MNKPQILSHKIILLTLSIVLGNFRYCAQSQQINLKEAPPLGVYRWANKAENVDAFSDWLGRPTVWAVDFIGWESWDNVQWPTWWLEGWSKWVHAQPDRKLILSVPILVGPSDRSGPIQGNHDVGIPVSLQNGAEGKYNHHFKQLAENIVAYKLGDIILRLGWEFNGNWYTWAAKDQTDNFAKYWRHIVTTIRSVPGTEGIKFCWNPTLGEQDFPAEKAWPGRDFVDYIGIDVYDETWMENTYPWPAMATDQEIEAHQQKAWKDWILNSPRGLAYWVDFSKKQNLPLAFPEWGLNSRIDRHGGEDNPYFIQSMHDFVSNPQHNVAFHCYFDVNAGTDHIHQLSSGLGESGQPEETKFPKAAMLFKKLFTLKP